MYFTKKRERERKKRKGKFAIIIILTFELAFPRFQSRNKDEKVSRPERAMSGINGSCGKLYIHNRCKEVFWPCLTSTFNYVIKYTGYVHRIYESLNRLIIASILLSLSMLLFYLAILDRNLHHLFQKNGTRCWTKSLIIHELYRYLVDSVCSSKKRERERNEVEKKKKGRKIGRERKGRWNISWFPEEARNDVDGRLTLETNHEPRVLLAFPLDRAPTILHSPSIGIKISNTRLDLESNIDIPPKFLNIRYNIFPIVFLDFEETLLEKTHLDSLKDPWR